MFDIHENNISRMMHPEYIAMIDKWAKYRLTFEGGDKFISQYLCKFSKRETSADYDARKKVSYCPAHAKAAVVDIQNAIASRMPDIIRSGGPDSWKPASKGLEGGIDLCGNTTNSFMGKIFLPELCSIGKCAIFVDKPMILDAQSMRDVKDIRPYLYIYSAEDIRSWTYNTYNQLESILLRNTEELRDPETGLTIGTQKRYILFNLLDQGVRVTFYDKNGNKQNEHILNLRRIPITIGELTHSLLVDIAGYQIALLNLASSDINYSLKANYPFYTEQYDPITDISALVRQSISSDEEEYDVDTATVDSNLEGKRSNAQKANDTSVKTGAVQGRRYPKGLNPPAFINPSPDPIIVSMKKAEELKTEIRQLLNLALNSVMSVRASAESKKEDNKSLEAGLASIGLEMEHVEREIAEIWCEYEGSDNDITIKYPRNYSLKTDVERREEAIELAELRDKIPSDTYKKAVSKDIAKITLGLKLSEAELDKIDEEIETAVVINTDHTVVRADHEAGFVSTKTASKILGYPEGEVEQAKRDHAERIERIVVAQSSEPIVDPAARGVDDLDSNLKGADDEKKKIQNQDTDDVVKNGTKGKKVSSEAK